MLFLLLVAFCTASVPPLLVPFEDPTEIEFKFPNDLSGDKITAEF